MRGSLDEADDAVQESWLRLSRPDISDVENIGGWLTTVVARVCLDMLRLRTSRREEPLGAHLSDPIASHEDGIVLLVVLDTLAPAERIAFVLRHMFAVPFDEVAPIVGRSPAAARQLASPARRRVRGVSLVPDADLIRQRAVVAPSSLPRAGAISKRCSRCSIPMSCSGPVPRPYTWAHQGRATGLVWAPGRSSTTDGPAYVAGRARFGGSGPGGWTCCQ